MGRLFKQYLEVTCKLIASLTPTYLGGFRATSFIRAANALHTLLSASSLFPSLFMEGQGEHAFSVMVFTYLISLSTVLKAQICISGERGTGATGRTDLHNRAAFRVRHLLHLMSPKCRVVL